MSSEPPPGPKRVVVASVAVLRVAPPASPVDPVNEEGEERTEPVTATPSLIPTVRGSDLGPHVPVSGVRPLGPSSAVPFLFRVGDRDPSRSRRTRHRPGSSDGLWVVEGHPALTVAARRQSAQGGTRR